MDSDNKGTGSEQQSGLHSHAYPGAPVGVDGCHCNAWTVSYWYICMSLTTSPQCCQKWRFLEKEKSQRSWIECQGVAAGGGWSQSTRKSQMGGGQKLSD